jgi:glycosyltransferase involved in cell wall biosynthesis
MPDLYFVIPGDLHTLTGGYGYDRRLLTELALLGVAVEHLPLSGAFPTPDATALSDADATLAALPAGSVVLIDGLAFGAMPDLAVRHGTRLQLIALCHHPLALEAGLTNIQAQRLLQSEQRALAQAVAVVVTSAVTAGVLQRDFAVPAEKITIAPPGTDTQRFAPCTGNPPLLLTVATLTRRKAHDVLIAALAQIAQLPWVARFVGGSEFDPVWAAALQQQVAAHGLQQRIQFVGGVTDVRAEYAQADLFVLPSLYEGYGMACAEALAFGLPVVTTRVGAIPEVVPVTAGVLVEPADVATLAAALNKLLGIDSGAALRASLQQGARSAAQQLPRWSATAEAVATLVNTVRTK